MGFWEWLTGKKQPQFAPQRASAPPRGIEPAQRQSVNALARVLLAEFPDEVDYDVVWDRCERAGRNPSDVVRRMDELRYAAEEIARRTVETLKPSKIIDLSELESVRMRIKGQAHWVTVAEREKFSSGEYWLVREPRNEYDKSAVAVFGRGRKVGYVSAARAAMIAPFLDELGADAFKVGGVGVGDQGIRMWVDVPKVEALRKFVRTRLK